MVQKPRPATRFVGRDTELEAVERALHEHRLVTLWGPPGVGKSRLAAEVCARAAADPEAVPHAHWDLSPAQSIGHASSIIAQGLDLELGPEPNNAEQLGRLLAERGPLVIVLDNFDQAAHDAGPTLAQWLAQAPDASWLVTSRGRLGLPEEHVLEIKPLSASAALELFADRARQQNHGFALTPEGEQEVAALVERLDRLPLAIELCASRAGVLSPAQLAAELARGLDLLSAPARGELRGLGDAIESAWAALSPAEQTALAQCSAFVGAFDARSAAEVVDLSECEQAPALFDVIQSLVDHSLLAPAETEGSASRRFQMLLCIAEFAREKLRASGKRREVYARHAAHFSKVGREWAERTLAFQDLEARSELEQAKNELMAIHQRALDPESGLAPALAVKAALALLPWYRRFGPYSALLNMLDRALSAAPDLDPALACKAIGARGSTFRLLGRLSEARTDLERAIEIARRWEHAPLATLLETELAQTELDMGDPASAQARQRRALEQYKKLGQRVLEGHALLALGSMHFYVDDLDAAERFYAQALGVHREVGDRVYECEALRSLALVELELGRRTSARAHFEEALAAIERINERRWRPRTLGYYAILEQEEGHHTRAMALYTEAIAEARWVGSWRTEAVFRGYLGTCLLEQGALDEARAAMQRAVDDLGGFERMVSRALFRACISVIDTMRGDIDAAARELELSRIELDKSPEQVFFRRAVEIHAGHLELARARQAAHLSELTESEALYLDARVLLEHKGFEQSDVRFARRLLERALSGWVPPRRIKPWRVHETGLWFEPPYSARVDLGRKHALRRLLVSLAERHAKGDRSAIAPSDLIAAGWPGERIQRHAAQNRLRVALHTLRRLGLNDLLVTHADGYHLDPKAAIELVSA